MCQNRVKENHCPKPEFEVCSDSESEKQEKIEFASKLHKAEVNIYYITIEALHNCICSSIRINFV